MRDREILAPRRCEEQDCLDMGKRADSLYFVIDELEKDAMVNRRTVLVPLKPLCSYRRESNEGPVL